MKANSVLTWFAFWVRVNGIEFHQLALRPGAEYSTRHEIVVRDRHLGSFALHDDFLLEAPKGKQNNQQDKCNHHHDYDQSLVHEILLRAAQKV